VEKEATLGGNSIKASSGINGCCVGNDGVVSQEEVDSFVDDTIQSAGDRANAELVQTLVEHSHDSLEWLKDRLSVELSSKTQLGGHGRARTQRPEKSTVGFSLISALKKELEKYQEKGALKIMTSTRAIELIQESSVKMSPAGIKGVKVIRKSEDGQESEMFLLSKNVMLATGGFAAARDKKSLLAQHAPHLLHMPATFGSFSTGDGIQLAVVVGAGLVDMDKVQIHPTGFVDPKDSNNPSKILCAEVMRGVGGVLLCQGKRFCNELGTRDYVVSQMTERNKETHDESFYLLLSSAAAKKANEHVGFYSWKGLLHKLPGVDKVEEYIKTEPGTVRQMLLQYQEDAKSGTDAFGKTSFPDLFSTDLDTEDFYVGCVTPVLHYCMGGVTINSSGQVLNEEQQVIPGLWAAGEVAGGVHGGNRLAGNSLLECLVYGRIIGKQIQF
jgi:flavocytochrome c